MYVPLNRRTFIGFMVSSAWLITARPQEAPAALITSEFADQDKRRILDYVFALIDKNFDARVDVQTPTLSHRFLSDEFRMVWVAFLKDRQVIACKGLAIPSPVSEARF